MKARNLELFQPPLRRISMPRHSGDSMVAWSLHAPYSGAVADGAKPIETRSWMTNYRGEIVIHGALKIDQEAVARLGKVATSYTHPALRGALLAIARIANARPLVKADEPKALFYADNRVAYELEDVRWLRPVPWKGQQGPFLVPRKVIDEALVDAPKSMAEFIAMREEQSK